MICENIAEIGRSLLPRENHVKRSHFPYKGLFITSTQVAPIGRPLSPLRTPQATWSGITKDERRKEPEISSQSSESIGQAILSTGNTLLWQYHRTNRGTDRKPGRPI